MSETTKLRIVPADEPAATFYGVSSRITKALAGVVPFVRPSTVKLYGVRIPSSDLHTIKAITELLVGCTTTQEYKAAARERCVHLALEAVAKATVRG